MTFTRVALQDVAQIVGGGRLKLSGNDFVDSGFPAYGAGGMNGLVPVAEFKRSAVVLSAIGARCGKCFLAQGEWTSLANTQLIFPDEKEIDVRFLWYQLNDEARWPRAGVAQPFIKPSDVKSHLISLPPLGEQKRIAAILDQADALRRLNARALEHLNSLPQAIFQEMFIAQADDWPKNAIDDLAVNVRTGPFGSQLLSSELVDAGIPVLGIDNVVTNEFVWGKPRYITSDKYQTLRRYTVLPGDVLITIMGTIGRCAIVPSDIPTAINTKHICCLTPRYDLINSEYLRAAFLYHPDVLKQLGVQQKGAIMPGLNMGIIKSLILPLPPLALQREFTKKLSSLHSVICRVRRQEEKTQALFTSLQHRAFQGELQ